MRQILGPVLRSGDHGQIFITVWSNVDILRKPKKAVRKMALNRMGSDKMSQETEM